MIILETKRLLVKASSLENFDTAYQLLSDPDIMRYVGRGPRTHEETRTGLEKMIEHRKKHGFSFGDVYEKETGLYVGRAGMIYLELNDTQPEIEVGYMLHKQYWKKGYATELAKAFIQWGFNHFSLEKIVAVINPKNDASRRVLERCGMSYMGMANHYDQTVAKYEIRNQRIDDSNIKLTPATLNEHPILQNMGRFYVYDMSEYVGHEAGWEIPQDGLYECIDFKKYWSTPNAFPFLIRYKNELAGFVIVDKKGSDAEIDYNMAQFFILRKFKGKGLGSYVAHQCFDTFRGKWEVMVIPGNEGAYRFWRSTIQRYCENQFIEYTKDIAHFNNSRKNIFQFDT